MEWGCESITYCFNLSYENTNYAAKIRLMVLLLRGKKTVTQLNAISATSVTKKKKIKLKSGLHFRFKFPHPTLTEVKFLAPGISSHQILHKTQTTQMKLDFSESEWFCCLMEFRILTFCFSYLTYCFKNFGFRIFSFRQRSVWNLVVVITLVKIIICSWFQPCFQPRFLPCTLS